MSRALITGVSGQDGGYLCELLLAGGVEVHGVDRAGIDTDDHPWLDGITLHEGDITDVQVFNGFDKQSGVTVGRANAHQAAFVALSAVRKFFGNACQVVAAFQVGQCGLRLGGDHVR